MDIAAAPGLHDSRDAITRFLYVADAPRAVDLCLVLGAPTVSSMRPAVDLWRAGLVPRLLISGRGPRTGPYAGGPPEWEVFRAFALAEGVPEDAILLECEATNTRENFVLSAAVVEAALGWARVRSAAIVGKPFHMRRALMTARRHWPADLELVMLPSRDPQDFPAESWWRSEAGRAFVLAELKAIGTYALQDDLGGF
jgi:uncharacterized SAM-binding protein YcdF (DUF218 family)